MVIFNQNSLKNKLLTTRCHYETFIRNIKQNRL